MEAQGCVIGLDLSLTGTGFVILSRDGTVLKQGKVGYPLKKDARVKEQVERMLHIARAIIDVIKTFGVEMMAAIERLKLSGVVRKGRVMIPSSMSALAELHGTIKSQLWLAFGIEPTIVVATSARKVVFGRGNIPKAQVKPTLETMMDVKFIDHDAADAYVVAEFLRRKLCGSTNEGD